MKEFHKFTGLTLFQFYEYILKALAGVVVGYIVYKAYPQQSGQYFWLFLSILLSITHDNNYKVAYDRVKGNIIGSAVGLAVFFLHTPPNLLTIGIGVVLTIALSAAFKLISVARTALVGFIIIVVFEETHAGWAGAVERLVFVTAGCVIGLAITYIFSRIARVVFQQE